MTIRRFFVILPLAALAMPAAGVHAEHSAGAVPPRVASLLPWVADALDRVGPPGAVVAVTRRDLHQAPAPPRIDLGSPHSPSFELLAAARPTLIVGDRVLHGPQTERLERAGTEVFLVDAASVEATFDSLLALARRVGSGDAMARELDAARSDLRALRLGHPVPVLVLFGTPSGFLVVTERSWLGDLVAQVGFGNVAIAGAGAERHPGYVELADEILAGLSPDLVLLVTHGDPTRIRAAFAERTAAGPLHRLGEARRGVHVLSPALFASNPWLAMPQAARAIHDLAVP